MENTSLLLSVAGAAALAVGAACLALALLHVMWALGGRWPGTDDASLFDIVVGAPMSPRAPPTMPGPIACLIVAVLLSFAGAVVVIDAFAIVDPGVVAPALVDAGALAVALAFFVRGAGGLFEHRLRPIIRGTRYERLNRVLYSPLCLALAALTAFSVGMR